MTNLEYFNEAFETNLSAEDTALGMILDIFEKDIVRAVRYDYYMENNDNCRRYTMQYHYIIKWLNEEKKEVKKGFSPFS